MAIAIMNYLATLFRTAKNVAIVACVVVAPLQAQHHNDYPPGSTDLPGMIRKIRESWFRSNEHLEGKIRKGGVSVSFRIALKTAFVELALGEARFRIPKQGGIAVDEFRDGQWKRGDSILVTTPIADTQLSFEDIAFRFLTWPDPKKVGTAVVRTRLCSVIRFTSPQNQSAYKVVDLFLDEDSLMPLRVVCYGTNGTELKRFDPVKVRRIENKWTIQSIRVTRMSEVTGPDWEPTYIEFEPLVVGGALDR